MVASVVISLASVVRAIPPSLILMMICVMMSVAGFVIALYGLLVILFLKRYGMTSPYPAYTREEE